MKHSILAITVLSTIAFGISAKEKINVELLGETAYGFEYSDKAQGVKDISKLDFGVSVSYDNAYAMVFGESGTMTSKGYGHGVDGYGIIMNRVFMGYNINNNVSVQIGSMDSALDLVKDYGNKTVEYSHNATTVEDVRLAVGAFGTVSSIDYGLTVNSEKSGYDGYQAGWNDASALSAYAKTKLGQNTSILGGFEYRMGDETSAVMMGAIDFGLVGANIYHDTKTDATGGSLSIGTKVLKSVYAATGYNFETGSNVVDSMTKLPVEDLSYINAGILWQQTDHFVLKADAKFDLSNQDDHKFWVRQTYTF
ncbi:hypothetical protein [Vibrio campbellii]|uniref:hypothetical protein n=1 Tax=Vibrio campbellii TaxID=680 RepID=UPI000CD32F23|nr:hypothetical protein [Vibrio campbellii]AUW07439.1 hypothetical protein C1N51_27680 [Vibrio campbellii]